MILRKNGVVLGFFTRQYLIDPLKREVMKNNKGLEVCYGQALMKIGRKVLIDNPIGMFLVEIPGSPKKCPK